MMKSCGLYTRLGSLTPPPPSMQDFVDCWLCLNVHCQPSPGILNVGPSKCGDLHTADSIVWEDPVLSVMWMIIRWRIKNLLLFLVWWFKLFLIPGIHKKGEEVSIENNSRENQSTPAVLCKDVADGEGISNLISRHYREFMYYVMPLPSFNKFSTFEFEFTLWRLSTDQ